MPRQARLDLPDVAQHVVQRGNDRRACFFDELDYRCYLRALRDAATVAGCAVHSYVLMTNHVHLLVTPRERGCVARMMQRLGTEYVAFVNRRHARTGSLWEGRYRACLVAGDRYLLACQRYIELNPVRAGLARAPAHYAWSSHAHYAGAPIDAWLVPSAAYQHLGSTPDARRLAYAELVRQSISDDELRDLRGYVRQQRALGPPAFQQQIAEVLGRHVRARSVGRPRRDAVTSRSNSNARNGV